LGATRDVSAVGKREKIADGPVGGGELFFNDGLADGVVGVNELLAEGQGQGGELIEARPPLPVESVQQLAEAVGGLCKALYQIGKLLIRKA
jgi:hypothetical protein